MADKKPVDTENLVRIENAPFTVSRAPCRG
jgi:hypothetical protein